METSEKRLWIGVDEAGYGPNLGPLVVAASVWLAPAKLSEDEICFALSQDFAAKPWKNDCKHVPLGDSKRLYQPGKGLKTLEGGLLALIESGNTAPSLHGFFKKQARFEPPIASEVSEDQDFASTLPPWYLSLQELDVPVAQSTVEVDRLRHMVQSSLKKSHLQLLATRAVVVTESVFNLSVNRLGSKGMLLSQVTLDLVARLLRKYNDYPAAVFCDRQGGRRNYLPILSHSISDEWFRESANSSQRCSYVSSGSRQIEIHFSVGGDSFPPAGLASMLAKYLRERLMGSFNDYWQQHVPSIKPTAGYPVDAKRFRAEIESTARKLGLETDQWWRCK